MVFSSTVLVFLFLPLLLGLHAVCPMRLRNGLLLGASLLFYAWGEPTFLPIMLLSGSVKKLPVPACKISAGLRLIKIEKAADPS
jgi:hypothetical protein